ncbi:MAG: class I adenylate-forming enzyme family protein [Planctomycetota bacterium]|jgi:long-chain acyl-CoA synthetase
MQLAKSIIRRLLLSPRRVCVVDDQRAWKGYQLYIAALHVARAIRQATDAEHVGIMLPTSGLFPMTMLGTWMLGRTCVPLNYLFGAEELEYVIRDAGVDTVVTVGPMLKHVAALPADITQIRLDEMSFGGFPPLRRTPSRRDDHLAALLYTSGTSGRPKGVMLSAGNLSANVRQCVEWVGFTEVDGLVGVLPQFHSFGLTVLTLLPLTVGCKVIYTARFAPRKILDLLHEHRPTAMIAIPSMYNVLLNAKSATPDHFSSLKYIVSGGEPLPQSVADGFQERLGRTINEGYGLTETGPVTNWCRPQDHRPGSVGMALPRVQEKVVGEQGQRLGPGEEGEVCIRGPNIMSGYYKLPDQTAAVFDDEHYFRTGDMGRIDADGHLYITGRIKEMLIIGGENVFPREIEEVLNAHPSVHDSAVIGMMDPSRGEVPLAFVEPAEDAEFNETDLRSHCREHLAGYKVPREIRLIDKLPRNPTGKIMRRRLSAETPTAAAGARGPGPEDG